MQAVSKDSPANRTNPVRRGLKLVATGFAVVLLCLVLGLGWFTGTSAGLRILAGWAQGRIGDALDGSAEISGVSGTLWRDVRIASLRIASPISGFEIVARDIRLVWHPMDLFGGVLRIDEIGAGELVVALSLGTGPVEEVAAEPFSIPGLPVNLDLRRIDLPRITFSPDPLTVYQARLESSVGTLENGDVRTEILLEARLGDRLVDRLMVDATISPSSGGTVSARVEGMLPHDGLVWAISDIDPDQRRDTVITSNLSGTLEAIEGTVTATIQEIARLEGDIRADVGSSTQHASFQGVLDILSPSLLGLDEMLGGVKDIDLALSHAPGGDLSLDHLQIAQDGVMSVTGTGRLTEEGGVDAELALELAPAAAVLIDPSVGFREARAGLRLSGTLEEPILSLEAGLTDPTVSDLSAEEASLSLVATMSEVGEIDLDGGIRAGGVAWPEQELQAVIGPEPVLRFSGRISPTFERIENIALTAEPVGITMRGNVALLDGIVLGDGLSITVADLALFSELAGVLVKGRAELDMAALEVSADGSVSGDFAIRLSDLFLIDTETTALLGSSMTAEGTVLLTDEGGLEGTLAALTAQSGTLSGQLALPPSLDRIRGNLKARLDVGALPSVPGLTIAGSTLDLTARFDGSLSRPAASVTLEPFDARYEAHRLDGIALSAEVTWPGNDPAMALSLGGMLDRSEFSLRTIAIPRSERLELSDIRLQGLGVVASGDLALNGYTLPAEGELNLRSDRIGPAADFAGLDDLSGTFQSTVSLRNQAGDQAADVDLTLSEFAAGPDGPVPEMRIRTMTARITLADALSLDGMRAELRARSLAMGTMMLTEASVDVDLGKESDVGGALAGGRIDVVLKGREEADPDQPVPLSLAAGADVSRDGDDVDIRLDRLSGQYGDIPIQLQRDGIVRLDAAGVARVTLALGLSDGTVELDYSRNAKQAGLDVEITALPLSPFLALRGGEGLEGTLTARLQAEERGGAVTATAKADLVGIELKTLDKAEGYGMSLIASLENERLSLEARTEGPGIETGRLDATLPVRMRLVVPDIRLDTAAQMEGQVNLQADIAEFWAFIPLPEHAVSGDFGIEAHLTGSFDDPKMTGTARLDNMRYEHMELGTILTAVTGTIRFDDRTLKVEKLTGVDPAGSRFEIAGQGDLDFDAPRLSASLSTQNFQVIHNDGMKFWTDIDLTAELREADSIIAGDIAVRRAEINLNIALPPSIPTLDIREEGGGEPSAPETSFGPDIALDIRIALPGQVFVRGRGLDSEWEGALQVAGTVSTPLVTGRLAARRGTFDVIGKSFALRDSEIRFLGGDKLDPLLGIRGVYEESGLTVIARLAGPSSRPEVILESQPSLPQDEILSRVLFGKNKGALTAAEGIQLAASVSELSGGGSGLDVLGSIREVVGVDVLQVDTGEGGAAVKAGKYIADGVYVGARQGAAPGSGSVEVEVELTPNISVNTESGQTDSSVGVQFKWDY